MRRSNNLFTLTFELHATNEGRKRTRESVRHNINWNDQGSQTCLHEIEIEVLVE